MTHRLFEPAMFGAIAAANRIMMGPMTRARGTRAHIPTDVMTDYYRQRAGAGIIISEATGISRQGLGWPFAPGIWSDEQIEAWLPATAAVHDAGGRILCQLWHMGRVVDPSFLDGAPPVSASATVAPNEARTYEGRRPYTQARPLEVDEIPAIVEDFAQAARNAITAGFDGVQLHAGSGYLLDQFMRDGTNHRTDRYGGPIENRLRFLIEVVDAVAAAISPGRLSVRFSPNAATQGCADSDAAALFTAAAKALSPKDIAFLELREPAPDGIFGITDAEPVSPLLRKVFRGPLILNEDYDLQRACAALDEDKADGISFGRAFIANPDLVERMRAGVPLAQDAREHWYTQGAVGYSDYEAADLFG